MLKCLVRFLVNYPILAGMVGMVLYFVPYLILGDNSYMAVHDNLDSSVLQGILISRNHNLFDMSQNIGQVMNGIPRFCFPSGLNITMWLFYIFPPLLAYFLNDFIVRFLAFTGMYLLLKKHFLSQTAACHLITFFVALCFALTPFYTMYGLSSAGLPLLLLSFLNLLKGGKKIINYVVIALFPLYSSLVLSGVFACVALAFIWLLNGLKNKQINLPFLFGLMMLSVSYLIVEYGLLYSYFFDTSYVSHRSEWMPKEMTFLTFISGFIQLFFVTQYHSGTIYTLLIVFTVLMAIYINRRIERNLLLFILSIFSIFMFSMLARLMSVVFGKYIHLFVEFQFDRFYFLLPFVWMVLFAIAIAVIYDQMRSNKFKYVVSCLIMIQFGLTIYANTPYINQIKSCVNNVLPGSVLEPGLPTYRSFYATQLFDQIRRYINQPPQDYRVVCVGFHPAVAQYNCFYTLDAYQTNYPLAYKHEFRLAIAGELDKDKSLKQHFDGWGSRCYAFSASLGADLNKKFDGEKIDLAYSYKVFARMGVKYLLSASEIIDSDSRGLFFEKKFDDHHSFYQHIYLYQIIIE